MRHAPSSLFAGSPLRPGCATSSPRLRAGPPPHALYPFAQTAGVQHGQCANPLLSVRGQSPPPWLRHPHPWFTRSTPPTHPPPLCTRDGGTAQTVRHPPPFRSRTIPPPGLRHPPPPVYAPRLARTPATPLRACRRRRVDSAPPPLFGWRGLPPPSVRGQSPPPALPFARMPGSQEAQRAHLSARGSPLRSGYAIPARPARPPPLRAHAEGWCAPARSSLAQPALVPAPPCSRLT